MLFLPKLDLIRRISSATFKNDSSIFPSKPNISLNKKQQFAEVLRFSGSEAVMNFMSSFLQQVEREGRVAARGSGGHIYYFEVLRPLLDDSPAVDVGDADNEQHSSRPNLPDIRNEPEPEPDSHPDNEVDIDIEIEIESDSDSDGGNEQDEEIAVVQPAKERSQGDSRSSTTAASSKSLAEIGSGLALQGPSYDNDAGCPIVPAENRNSEEEAGEGREVAGGDGSDKKFVCQVEGCNYRAAQKVHLKIHMANKHDVGVVWHHCGVNGCKYKAKHASHLKRHKMHVHDIGVTWHHCNVVGCTFKSKERGNLKRHKKNMH